MLLGLRYLSVGHTTRLMVPNPRLTASYDRKNLLRLDRSSALSNSLNSCIRRVRRAMHFPDVLGRSVNVMVNVSIGDHGVKAAQER